MEMVEILNELMTFIERQVDLEENDKKHDWLAEMDEALMWIERLDNEKIEVSEPVFLFLEEVLQRRDKSFGDIRRSQIKTAIENGSAFPDLVPIRDQ